MVHIPVKQKEAKTVRFTISGTFDLSMAEFVYAVKNKKSEGAYVIKKEDTDFDKTEITNRKVKVTLTESDLDLVAGSYISELKIILGADNIDKSADITLMVEEAVIHD